LAGTNNLGKTPSDDPERVTAAVLAISDRLKRKCPTAKTLIISILPSGKAGKREFRKRIKIANTALAALLSESETAYLDIHNLFLDGDGRWKPGLSIDGTHLTKSGYDVFARALRPEIERLITVSDQKSSP
jgi:lysophospholipase L1-like esterase